jgi:hypothetical protein
MDCGEIISSMKRRMNQRSKISLKFFDNPLDVQKGTVIGIDSRKARRGERK